MPLAFKRWGKGGKTLSLETAVTVFPHQHFYFQKLCFGGKDSRCMLENIVRLDTLARSGVGIRLRSKFQLHGADPGPEIRAPQGHDLLPPTPSPGHLLHHYRDRTPRPTKPQGPRTCTPREEETFPRPYDHPAMAKAR